MFDNVSTAEKIETIVDCFDLRGINSGVFGTLRAGIGRYHVTTDGREFTVWCDGTHWHVREGDAEGVDAMLVYAASNLIGADLVRKTARVRTMVDQSERDRRKIAKLTRSN